MFKNKTREFIMRTPSKLLAAAVLSAGALALAVPASAEPIARSSTLRQAGMVENVAWRGGWRRGVWVPGLVAGAVVGGAIAATQPWNYGYYGDYAYAPGYYAPSYSYEYSPGYGGGDASAYCAQRFRSYDPASGTYLGYDGERHPCP